MALKPGPDNHITADPNPSYPSVAVDNYPDLCRLVEAEALKLYGDSETLYHELRDLTEDQDWQGEASILDDETEVPSSADELIARLNGIGQTAYRLARLVRPLVDARAVQLGR